MIIILSIWPDPDPKQIIPDPRKSSGSDRIRILWEPDPDPQHCKNEFNKESLRFGSRKKKQKNYYFVNLRTGIEICTNKWCRNSVLDPDPTFIFNTDPFKTGSETLLKIATYN